jgi:hypothetical protein
MTGDLFRVYDGKLVRVGEEEFPQSITRFSEVFAWPVQGVSVPASRATFIGQIISSNGIHWVGK